MVTTVVLGVVFDCMTQVRPVVVFEGYDTVLTACTMQTIDKERQGHSHIISSRVTNFVCATQVLSPSNKTIPSSKIMPEAWIEHATFRTSVYCSPS